MKTFLNWCLFISATLASGELSARLTYIEKKLYDDLANQAESAITEELFEKNLRSATAEQKRFLPYYTRYQTIIDPEMDSWVNFYKIEVAIYFFGLVNLKSLKDLQAKEREARDSISVKSFEEFLKLFSVDQKSIKTLKKNALDLSKRIEKALNDCVNTLANAQWLEIIDTLKSPNNADSHLKRLLMGRPLGYDPVGDPEEQAILHIFGIEYNLLAKMLFEHKKEKYKKIKPRVVERIKEYEEAGDNGKELFKKSLEKRDFTTALDLLALSEYIRSKKTGMKVGAETKKLGSFIHKNLIEILNDFFIKERLDTGDSANDYLKLIEEFKEKYFIPEIVLRYGRPTSSVIYDFLNTVRLIQDSDFFNETVESLKGLDQEGGYSNINDYNYYRYLQTQLIDGLTVVSKKNPQLESKIKQIAEKVSQSTVDSPKEDSDAVDSFLFRIVGDFESVAQKSANPEFANPDNFLLDYEEVLEYLKEPDTRRALAWELENNGKEKENVLKAFARLDHYYRKDDVYGQFLDLVERLPLKPEKLSEIVASSFLKEKPVYKNVLENKRTLLQSPTMRAALSHAITTNQTNTPQIIAELVKVRKYAEQNGFSKEISDNINALQIPESIKADINTDYLISMLMEFSVSLMALKDALQT